MHRASLFLLVLLLATAQAAARGEDEVAGALWRGILPDPEPTLDAEHFVCRVVDDGTGEPVVGARLVRTPEWIAPSRLRHDVPLGVAQTDAHGVAWLPTTPGRWEDECHWLVTAEGYGFAYEYGTLPPVEVRLRPEVRVGGRVVDALGRPVPGARVEALGGCSHGTAASSALTDARGRFTLSGIGASLPGQLWVAGPGIAADLIALDGPRTVGRRGVLLTMETGVRYRGRVVDLLGHPVQRAVVRAHNEQRGPATATAADGTFLLDGVEETSALSVYSPGDLGPDGDRFVSDAVPGVPCTAVVSPLGVVEVEMVGRLRVRALDPATGPVGGLPFAILSVATGRGPQGTTAAEAGDGLAVGEALEDVGVGPWRIVPTDPLASHVFDPVEVPAGAVGVFLSVRSQARLRIVGALPEDASLQLAVSGASAWISGDAEDPLSWLPVDGPAALRVTLPDRPPLFFPAGPVVEGVRTARVVLPEPRRILLPAGAVDARLADGEREAYQREVEAGDVLLTDARGPLTLSWSDADGQRWATRVIVPDEPGGLLVVDGHEARRVMPEPDDEDDEATGPCTLSITVRDADGPVDAILLVGDTLRAAPEGRLTVGGLPAGPLRVVVARRDVVGTGRLLDLVLADGAPATSTVELSLE